MVRMAELAPKGVFEDEDLFAPLADEAPYERHYDDFSRNCEDAA